MTDAQLRDRVEIRTLMDRYGIAVDSEDWALFRTLFTPDCVFDYRELSGPKGDLDTIVAWLSAGSARYAGRHANMTTHHCEITGPTAKAVTYFISYRTTVDGEEESLMTVGGMFKDRLVNTADGWRISERCDLMSWLPSPLPQRLKRPSWYATMDHHRPTLLED